MLSFFSFNGIIFLSPTFHFLSFFIFFFPFL
uniref:Uncharacterized protein n=1 Tax=Anguilla anguilla TaxID=7936 RepID=A0A0E9UUG2_ANGAN